MLKLENGVEEEDAEFLDRFRDIHLVDFVRLWPTEFRGVASGALKHIDTTAKEKFVLQWMIELADRVGLEDVEG